MAERSARDPRRPVFTKDMETDAAYVRRVCSNCRGWGDAPASMMGYACRVCAERHAALPCHHRASAFRVPVSDTDERARMNWSRSWRADPLGRELADRHYNRQKVGATQFVPPGRCVVLLATDAKALWVTSWPYAAFVRHEWAGAWMNSTYRREDGELASTLIVEAVAATRYLFGDPPPLGMVTFINPAKVPGFFRRGPNGRTLEWGYAYWCAGFVHVGWTKKGLYAMQLLPGNMPAARAPLGELELEVA